MQIAVLIPQLLIITLIEWSSHLLGILYKKIWMFHYQLQHQVVAFFLMLLSLYFTWKYQLLYYNAVFTQFNMIWLVWGSIQTKTSVVVVYPNMLWSCLLLLQLSNLRQMHFFFASVFFDKKNRFKNELKKWILEHKLPVVLGLLVFYLPLILFHFSLQQIV